MSKIKTVGDPSELVQRLAFIALGRPWVQLMEPGTRELFDGLVELYGRPGLEMPVDWPQWFYLFFHDDADGMIHSPGVVAVVVAKVLALIVCGRPLDRPSFIELLIRCLELEIQVSGSVDGRTKTFSTQPKFARRYGFSVNVCDSTI